MTPQGDPAGPLVMNLLMLAMMKKADAALALNPGDYFHVLYMDDRTFVGRSQQSVQDAQTAWADTTRWFNLKENAEKAQYVNTEKRYDSFEVLGATIGTPGSAEIAKSIAKGRMEKAKLLYKKIGLLPEGLAAKLNDGSIFVKGVVGYGWISQTPTKQLSSSLKSAMWASLGKTKFASLQLRRVMAGAHSSLQMISGMKQLKMLAKRDQILQELGISKQACLLDTHVSIFLQGLQWTLHGTFQHELLKESFCAKDLVDKRYWERTAHLVRESYRWQSYLQFCAEDRREIRGKPMPLYSGIRRQTMLRWVGNDCTAILAAIGGIQSPLLKFKLRGKASVCSHCKIEANPSWDHLWLCAAGIERPEDTMLARVLWPRDVRDLHLCAKVLQCLRNME